MEPVHHVNLCAACLPYPPSLGWKLVLPVPCLFHENIPDNCQNGCTNDRVFLLNSESMSQMQDAEDVADS